VLSLARRTIPYHDNGIKIFSPSGQKIADDVERLIEADISQALNYNLQFRSQTTYLLHQINFSHIT
jgi:phosphomannomutase